MNKEQDTSIEMLMARMEEITSQMEKESLPLADMMALYKEGRTLEKKIRTLLDLTEKEIEILSADEAEDGEEQTADDGSRASQSSPPQARIKSGSIFRAGKARGSSGAHRPGGGVQNLFPPSHPCGTG